MRHLPRIGISEGAKLTDTPLCGSVRVVFFSAVRGRSRIAFYEHYWDAVREATEMVDPSWDWSRTH